MSGRWWWLVVLPGAVLIVSLLEMWRRHRAYWHGPYWVEQIQVLKADTPLQLPDIKPLVGRKTAQTRWNAQRLRKRA